MQDDNNSYNFHTSTTTSWEAMLNACEQATTSIHLEEYVLDPDRIGTRFIECFIRKAREGVSVKLLLDGWGSKDTSESSLLDKMKDANIDVNFYNPATVGKLLSGNALPRDHRKLLLIDKTKAFIGGVCLYDNIREWRDTMIEIEGDTVDEIAELMHDTWLRAKGQEIPLKKVYHHDNVDDVVTSIYAHTPTTDDKVFFHTLLQKINQAKHSVYITTPYFTPCNQLYPALQEAAKRGVEVKAILSDYSKYAPYVVGKYQAGDLIRDGVQIYYYKPCMYHLKMMIIDSKWAAIGSYNMDGLSKYHNEEVMLVTKNRKLINTLSQHLEIDLQHSQEFSLSDWKARPLIEKIAGYGLYPLRKYL